MAQKSSLAHTAYLVTILIKGLVGCLEFISGVIIALTGPQRLYLLALRVTTPELYNGQHGHAARLIREGAAALAQSPAHFVIFYLLVHGVLKTTIVVALLRGRGRWVFPFASVVLAGFIAYFGVELAEDWSNWLFGLAAFDTLTLALVLNEWRNWDRKGR